MWNKLSDAWGIRFFLNSRSLVMLVLKSVLLLAIPYVYLMLCGLVFDYLLRWYFMTTFIFVSLVILYAIAIALLAWSVIRYAKARKRGAENGTGKS